MKYLPFGVALGSVVLLAALFVQPVGHVADQETDAAAVASSTVVYWTTPGLEPDTCLAAWLLTRIVTPGATVRICDHSDDGIPFDVQGADLSRPLGGSTSNVIAERFSIGDPYTRALVDVVRELELNPWTTNDEPLFMAVRQGLGEALNDGATDEQQLALSFAFLDRLQASERFSDIPNAND